MKELIPFRRPHFFSGKLLTADDLQAEQRYHLEKRKLHNRELHGWGVVSGLELKQEGPTIRIEPGLALDCAGNEIVVPESFTLDAPTNTGTRSVLFVAVCYQEQQLDPVTPSDDVKDFSSVLESFEAILLNENSNRGHRRYRGRWCACGDSHPLTIARLKKGTTGWRIDRHYNAPRLK